LSRADRSGAVHHEGTKARRPEREKREKREKRGKRGKRGSRGLRPRELIFPLSSSSASAPVFVLL
jgi:hypothetical protein